MGRSFQMTVVVVRDPAELANYVADLEKLAGAAIEPNIFYEPWFLTPGVTAFARDQRLEFVFIFAHNPLERGPKILCGFFPLERRTSYRGLRVSTLALWKHIHCYLCTPLIRREYGAECLETFFNWLATEEAGCSLMEFGLIRGDGPFHQLLVDHFHDSARLTYSAESHTRALFRPAADADQYLQNALSLKQRKGLKRRESELAASGKLEYLVIGPDDEVQPWIDGFLKLEASGWKGKEGSALACTEPNRIFFNEVVTAAFQRQRLLMLALHHNNQPIAYRCGMLAGPGSFSFKIAFDEDYAPYSPGVLLHLENIRYLHSHPEIHWMDSCTSPDNSMLNHLWTDRRAIVTIVTSSGKNAGDLAIAMLPLLRWFKRKLRNA